jgi:hypothetical protein
VVDIYRHTYKMFIPGIGWVKHELFKNLYYFRLNYLNNTFRGKGFEKLCCIQAINVVCDAYYCLIIYYAPRKISGELIAPGCPSVSPSVRPYVRMARIHVRPITSCFEVGFYNYFTEMITILRRRVARKIWVATLKVKVTAWPCSNIVSGP